MHPLSLASIIRVLLKTIEDLVILGSLNIHIVDLLGLRVDLAALSTSGALGVGRIQDDDAIKA